MTQIFISHTKENADCADHIRQGLEAQGYSVGREPTSLTMESILYPRTIENSILGSAAVVLVWSSSAAKSEWVERYILFAQRLKKPIFPVAIDDTALPNTLVSVTSIKSETPCTDVVAQLVPQLSSLQSNDPLIQLSEQAAHEYIRVRKEAIDHAAEMLQRDEHREAALAVLEYLARNDLMTGVRDKAQEVLDVEAKKSPPPQRTNESRHIFGVKCSKGHISYFDKRHECPSSGSGWRNVVDSAGAKLDELYLKCDQCGEEILVRIDCEGYK